MTSITLNTIAAKVTRPSVLNALHACRDGHPLNTPDIDHFYRAWFACAQLPSWEISAADLRWLEAKSQSWQRDRLKRLAEGEAT